MSGLVTTTVDPLVLQVPAKLILVFTKANGGTSISTNAKVAVPVSVFGFPLLSGRDAVKIGLIPLGPFPENTPPGQEYFASIHGQLSDPLGTEASKSGLVMVTVEFLGRHEPVISYGCSGMMVPRSLTSTPKNADSEFVTW